MSADILITGGLGNLGSWLTESYYKAGFNVTVLSKTNRNILPNCSYNFISCDISNKNECEASLKDKQFEYVIHAASSNDFFIDNYKEESEKTNAQGTLNILKALNRDKLKQVIYLSTFQVYGKFQGIITEDTPTLPLNDYGLSHLNGEENVTEFSEEYKIPSAIIRLTNSYGCPKDINSSKWYLVLNDLARMAVEKKEIVLKSNGNAPRDFIWMGDVCSIFQQITSLEQSAEGIFNLSGENTRTINEVANAVKNAYLHKYKKELEISVNSSDETIYSDDLFVDCKKLKNVVNLNARPIRT